MSLDRTIENLLAANPFYVDSCSWKFYEGGQTTEQSEQSAVLTITKLPDDKIPTVMINFKVHVPDRIEQLTLRLSPYEFDKLNALFKRASFRLEKV